MTESLFTTTVCRGNLDCRLIITIGSIGFGGRGPVISILVDLNNTTSNTTGNTTSNTTSVTSPSFCKNTS